MASQECSTIYIDGTFRTAPKPYKQIVTINGLYKDNAIPLVFALSTNKSTRNYCRILQVSCMCERSFHFRLNSNVGNPMTFLFAHTRVGRMICTPTCRFGRRSVDAGFFFTPSLRLTLASGDGYLMSYIFRERL